MVHERILISKEQLQTIVRQVADQINQSYSQNDSIVAIVLLEGAKYFAKDLLEKVHHSIQVEYLKASSYLGGTQSTGQVTIENSSRLKEVIAGKDVLLIDDIYDTGLTLSKVLNKLNEHNPSSIRTCVLLEKDIPHTESVHIDFLGTVIEDAFVIGYGLDYNEQYRDLPFIGVLKEELI
ncbi:MAG: hypoxanthine phosphoribosyltransferase [Planctomycetota bacterium]|jgi:hypoxanthine phosphoribosyltransferase